MLEMAAFDGVGEDFYICKYNVMLTSSAPLRAGHRAAAVALTRITVVRRARAKHRRIVRPCACQL